MEINDIATIQLDGQAVVKGPDGRDQRFAGVVKAQRLLAAPAPPVIVEPGEPAVRPHSQATTMAQGLIFLADVGPVEIADEIGLVESDQQRSIANRDVAWHPLPLLAK
jgi:hypothetical protein